MVVGKLINDSNQPLKYVRGYVSSESDPTFNERFITSRSGIFQIPNLRSGQYSMSFGKRPYDDISFEVPEDADGLYRLSQFIVQERLDFDSMDAETTPDVVEQAPTLVDVQFNDDELLRQLIDDILARSVEYEADLRLNTEPVDIVEPDPLFESVDRLMSIDISAMMASKSVIDRARALHYLKMQANYLKTVDFEYPGIPFSPDIRFSNRILKLPLKLYINLYFESARNP